MRKLELGIDLDNPGLHHAEAHLLPRLRVTDFKSPTDQCGFHLDHVVPALAGDVNSCSDVSLCRVYIASHTRTIFTTFADAVCIDKFCDTSSSWTAAVDSLTCTKESCRSLPVSHYKRKVIHFGTLLND